MNADSVMSELQTALSMGLLIATPLLAVALLIGVVIGLLQAATQVNEPAIAFIAKVFSMALVLAVGGGWMLNQLVQFTIGLYQRIPSMLG
ncbi:MAG: flagellar biosynthetic protein FliQ [Xanthomonadales bacterium]|jgi:flagellar biosynthetic protein FliQ|nr:flagellar biosynthetic protein FliQ [Xanthomonadales bacterium]